MKSSSAGNPSEVGQCSKCSNLQDLKEAFQSLVHSGRNLHWLRAIYPKPAGAAGASYCDLTKQTDFLLKSVFDAKRNYL